MCFWGVMGSFVQRHALVRGLHSEFPGTNEQGLREAAMNDSMTRMRWHARECVVPGVIALVVVACLPLIGMIAFALRPIVITGVLLVLAVALVRCAMGSHVRDWWGAVLASEATYRGLRIARDVAMDPGHCWALIEGDVVVGADDLVQSVLGPIDEVALPYIGRRVVRGEPLFRLRHGERIIELPSPVSGTVVAGNEALRERPELINAKPFGEGWVVRIHANRIPEERRHLLCGRRAWRWFQREVDLLLRLLPEAPVDTRLDLRIDNAAWSFIKRAFGAAARRA